MISYEEIRSVHIELSSNCNAACPLCPRNLGGMDYNAGYPITELSLADIQTIFPKEFVPQLKNILFNGNLGDFILAHQGIEIVEYFRQYSPTIDMQISTNGSARTAEYWIQLAKSDVEVEFCLDGLEDTHHLYRRNTSYAKILENAKTFIDAGGRAAWKMIRFDHNKHQILQCQELSKELGFKKFILSDHGRNVGLVFDRTGEYIYSIGKPKHIRSASIEIESISSRSVNPSNWSEPNKNITCRAKQEKEIYVASNGDIYPCCFLGFYPRTFDPKIIQGNQQIRDMLNGIDNNAIRKPLKECIEWFNQVENSWAKKSFSEGRLWQCNENCGQR